MTNQSLKEALKAMWKNTLNLLDIAKSDLSAHISNTDNPHKITIYDIDAAASNHTHNYAGSSSAGGAANSANKLNTNAGSATNPVYFSNGIPVKTTYTLGASVPSNAKFTDTTYGVVSTSADGLAPKRDGSTSKFLRGDGTWAVPPDTNTTYGTASSSTAGLVKIGFTESGKNYPVELNSSGQMFVNVPWTDTDTNTHYKAVPHAGTSSSTSATATSNGSTYINIVENGSRSGGINIKGSGATTVTSDANGVITINSTDTNTDTNTTYSLSGALSGNTFVNTLTPSSGSNTTATVPAMTAASSSSAGKAGLVPAPASGKQTSFLRGDGTWVVPSDTDTKNTTGSTDTSSKIFLVGATSQAANPQTYSHDTAYVGTDGCLYSNSTKVSVDGHTHSYAGSSISGGSATSAVKLDTSAGSATQPVYFSGGKPTACSYTLGKSVPSDAKFTDTTYTLGSFGITATAAELNVLDGITSTVTELNYCDGVTSNIQTQLNGKASSSHNHSAANITAGTLAGSVVANANEVSNLTTKQVRNTTISTAVPTSSDGGDGDIWITYGSTQSDCPFPVGGIYISVSSTSPSSLWSGTTWERIGVGRTLISAGGDDNAVVDENTYTGRGTNIAEKHWFPVGEKGGEINHILTTTEMPAHTHTIGSSGAHHHVSQGRQEGSGTGANIFESYNGASKTRSVNVPRTGDNGAHTHSPGSTGGDGAHNNMSTYLAVYMWKRVS